MATGEAISRSKYIYWHRASIGLFLVSLIVSHCSGLYMLAFGWITLKYSLAWFANPLLILAFVIVRPTGAPGARRWLVYGALTMMFVQPFDTFSRYWPLPILPWLASPVILLIGIELYRNRYRRAYATLIGNNDVSPRPTAKTDNPRPTPS